MPESAQESIARIAESTNRKSRHATIERTVRARPVRQTNSDANTGTHPERIVDGRTDQPGERGGEDFYCKRPRQRRRPTDRVVWDFIEEIRARDFNAPQEVTFYGGISRSSSSRCTTGPDCRSQQKVAVITIWDINATLGNVEEISTSSSSSSSCSGGGGCQL